MAAVVNQEVSYKKVEKNLSSFKGSNKAQDDTPSSPQNGSPACFSADTIVIFLS